MPQLPSFLRVFRSPWSRFALNACSITCVSLIVGALPLFAQSAESQPASTQTAETQPASTQPADTQPAATQPTEAEVAATQPSDSGDTLTIDGLTAQIKQTEAAAGGDEAAKARLLEQYRNALAQLQAAQASEAKAADLEKQRLDAPAQLEALKARLAARTTSQPASAPSDDEPETTSQPVGDVSGKTLIKLEQEAATAAAEKEAADQLINTLKDEAKVREVRTSAIPVLIAGLQKELQKAVTELDAPVDSPSALTLAKRTALLARKRALEAEIRLYETEIRSYEARRELLSLRRDLARLEWKQANRRANQARRDVIAQRKADAEAQQELARRELETAPAVIRELAERNLKLSQDRANLIDVATRVAREVKVVEDSFKKFDDRFKAIKSQVSAIGLNDEIGVLLRRQRAELPDVRRYERRIAQRKSEIARAKLEEYNLNAEREDLTDLEAATRRSMAQIPETASAEKKAELEKRVREMLSTQHDYLQSLKDTYAKYADDLLKLNAAERNLATVVDSFAQYIDENVLWIRSTGPIYTARMPADWLRTIADGWSVIINTIFRDARRNLDIYGIALAVVLMLILPRRRMDAALAAIAEKTSKVYEDRFRMSITALLITVFLSLLWPTITYFFAWRTSSALHTGGVAATLAHSDTSELLEAVSSALRRTALVVLLFSLARQICRRRGLAAAHVKWRADGIRILRRSLTLAMPVVVPTGFIVWACEASADNAWRDLIGRGAFIIEMIILSVLIWHVLRPKGGVLAGYLDRNKGGWVDDLKYVWYPLAVGAPVGFVIAATYGYYYTALQLEVRALLTLWLILAIVFVNGMLMRYFIVAQRRIAIEQVRVKREAEQAKAMEPPKPSDEVAQLPLPEKAVDLASVHTQTRRLVNGLMFVLLAVGAYLIWVDILPAFAFLNRIELWSNTSEVTETLADGATVTHAKVVKITLYHLGIAFAIAVVASVLSRNLPGLLEVTILQKLPLSNAGRYAMTTVSRYLIIVIGIIAAFGAIGVGWSQVQWLAAAITVGLGFGLQEIFANFVSGLIILFEQPIRPGDLVTVGDRIGIVSKIRIRATTLIDPDRKELIIPNKDLVTGNILNWTLSDTVTRLVFPVGVAYGSDPAKVEAALFAAIKGLPDVTDDPAPAVFFTAFGDSSLNFELRVFVKTLEARLRMMHTINNRIVQAFADAKLEIPFPQRDVYIRSVPKAIIQPEEPKPSAS